MAKCIVFGGTGFIGSHLVNKLLASGHNVTVFARNNDEPKIRDAAYIFGDFLNAHDIDEAVKGQAYVFHLISLTNPAISEEDPLIDIETNVKMTIHLLHSCVRHKVRRIIYTSSGGSIYGEPVNNPVSEQDAANPISPYAIGKQTIEGYLRYFQQKFKLSYMCLRISNVYGEGQNTSNNKHGVVAVFLGKIINGEPIRVLGDGTAVRDYIEVHDLTAFICETFYRKTNNTVYNIGSGKGTSVIEIIETIEELLGKRAKKEYIDAPASYVHAITLDCSRATEEFGEFASTPLNEGIRRMYAAMVAERIL